MNILAKTTSDYETVGFIIFLFAALIVFLSIYVPFAIVRHKYTSFVKKHSISIQTLNSINSNYKFISIPSFDMRHDYDNDNFFENISCRDYLIYQLQYQQKEVAYAINNTWKNKKMFEQYLEEIKEKCALNNFDTDNKPKNLKRLAKYEQKVFLKTCLNPTVSFSIKVRLVSKKMNGVTRDSKSKSFEQAEIMSIIRDLNNKKGNFYTNEKIWDAICRVERGKVSNKMRFAIYQRDGYRCRCCGRRTKDLEIDHIIPIAKGGKSTYNNLQTLCHRCNLRKGTDSTRY